MSIYVYIYIYGAVLTGAVLTGAVLTRGGAHLDDTYVYIYGAVLTGAVLTGKVIISMIYLYICVCIYVWGGAHWGGAHWGGAHWGGAHYVIMHCLKGIKASCESIEVFRWIKTTEQTSQNTQCFQPML
jgi:hypothetical protein